MIYTVFAEISALDTDSIINIGSVNRSDDFSEYYVINNPVGNFEVSEISSEIKEHILKVNNPEIKKERCAAYYLLTVFCKKIIGFVPKVSWNNNGKPNFVNNYLYFNLSHTKNMVALTVSDSKAVGVDIEVEIDEERARRLERRFFSELTISDQPAEVEYFYCNFDSDGSGNFISIDEYISVYEDTEKPNSKSCLPINKFKKAYTSDDFTARWTLYEASLKCDGGGFTSLPCLNMLLLETKGDIRLIETKSGKYYLSTSVS